MNGISVRVAEYLHFDMLRVLNEAFDKNALVFEVVLSLRLTGAEGGCELLWLLNDANSFSAPSRRKP